MPAVRPVLRIDRAIATAQSRSNSPSIRISKPSARSTSSVARQPIRAPATGILHDPALAAGYAERLEDPMETALDGLRPR